ncbi:MAG: hypothetical protein ACE5JN_08950 [Candidatus Methylomirabilia bacterium]
MDPRRVIPVAIACVLVGVLIGYLRWGRETQTLVGERDEIQASLTAETARSREIETKLERAESELKELADELEFERQRRLKLEGLISEGRK